MVAGKTHQYVLALDFGGTKLAAAVVDTKAGKTAALIRKSTPVEQGAEATIREMVAAGWEALEQSGVKDCVTRAGISFGGPVSKDRTTVLHSHHVAEWDGIILTEKITNTFEIPACMDNDANAAALGEWYFGAGERVQNMVYIQVSTGVGAGLILDHHLYRGGALAGEFGHITILPHGPTCVCDRNGCMESLCSGWAIARDGKDALQNAATDSPLWQLSAGKRENITARTVIDAYRDGDPIAKIILQQSFTSLGIGIANTICLFDPEIVVIGGGIARARDVMMEFLGPSLDQHVHHLFKNRYRLKFSVLDGLETLYGAALLTGQDEP
jgi:glucokinase